ncbi:MAG: hypothetical protein KGM46_03575 [Pseudomonadota bacterium]|nr:hypothetical protein [Xanthomonadaceae bacterium]MDE2247006.1 hypothetical protein [Xanthomonadaceae bacterium]MDE3209798.1 hypothetical protein [Pseudomonadota bacterium]
MLANAARSSAVHPAWLIFAGLAWVCNVTAAEIPAPSGQAGPSLGAHTLLAQADGRGSSPAVTQPITTRANGSSLLVLNGGYASNTSAPADSYANHWVQHGDNAVYHGYQGRFDVKAYVALSARGGPRHTVSLRKNGNASGEITVPFIEIRDADVLQDFAENYAVPGLTARIAGKLTRGVRRLLSEPPVNSVTLTSGEVTTTGPATLIAVWWGDAVVYRMTAVPDHGFTVIDRFLDLPPESGVQCAVAARRVDRAGTYKVDWTGSPAQGAILWLFAFERSNRPGR